MTKPDYRALCARMADELDEYRQLLLDDRSVTHRLADEARAALAEPEPEGPTKADLRQVFEDQSGYINDDKVMLWNDFDAAARAVLARWGHPTPPPQPVPASLSDESGMIPMEYADVDSGARIVCEPSEDRPSTGCWVVLNSHHISPLKEFPTAEAAYHALRSAIAADRAQHQPVPVSEQPWVSLGWTPPSEKRLMEPQPAPVAWMYLGEPDFDGTAWRENWQVTTSRQVATFKAQPNQPVPLVPAVQPVPVSERLPGPDDCDEEGMCWWGTPSFVNSCTVTQSAQWRLSAPDDRFGSELFWLPAHALPLPGEVK